MERRVAIIGAGISGLIASKYILEKGFHPIVFEAEDDIGGLWRHTISSTKLQTHRETYQFCDFPWHSSVKEDHPSHQQVVDYLKSYAKHFSITPYIIFNSKVINIEYVGESIEEMESWELWSGNGKPFSCKGMWHIEVEDTKNFSIEVYKAEFVVLCIGKYSGVPNIPKFSHEQGPVVFKGKVMHSMDYSALDNETATELIKGKRVTIVGSSKSAIDIATECANANGVKYPCTMIQRNAHWYLPNFNIWGFVNIGFLYLNRFAELLIHKPGESFILSLIPSLLSPLRWGVSKFIESYLKWKLPMKKYGLVPCYSFLEGISSCRLAILPEKFYDKIKEGSLVIKKANNFSFCTEGLMINGEAKPIETDLVIFATGYNGKEKLQKIFKSPTFQKYLDGPTTSILPLYRQIILPRIPHLAIIGYAESLSNLFGSEISCQWLAHFLDGNIDLPSIIEMEKEAKQWEDYMKQYAGNYFWKTCIATCTIWYNDQLCKDMGSNPRRKKGLFAELFEPYGPGDYVALTHKSG